MSVPIDPRVSVIIPCHTEKRWKQLADAVESILAQEPRPASVVVVVDHNEDLYERASRELTGVTVLRNRYPERGVSGNRNTGAFYTDTPLIALLDDDARAQPGWLAGLLAPFEEPDVVGTGGALLPMWQGGRPAWFPEEFLWVVGVCDPSRPAITARVRNVWSASMAMRREVFEAVGGFRVGFGKLDDRSRPEDTDLCLRMSQASGGHWMYVPGARADHHVPAARARFRTFLTRCYNEGRGKVEMARLNSGRDSLTTEREYLRRTLPRAVGRGLVDTVRGRGPVNAAKAASVLAGVAAAGFGGAVEMVRGRRVAPAAVDAPVPREVEVAE
jgi:GT2 family glycosyltransferase